MCRNAHPCRQAALRTKSPGRVRVRVRAPGSGNTSGNTPCSAAINESVFRYEERFSFSL